MQSSSLHANPLIRGGAGGIIHRLPCPVSSQPQYHPPPPPSRARGRFSLKSPSLPSPPPLSYVWASGIILLKSQQKEHQVPSGCCSAPPGLLMQLHRSLRSLATELLPAAPSPPRFLHLCSWQLPSSPRTHGRCWEDCVGGAGHEVRDLPQGPDVGGVVPLLHLLLDEAFQLLPERLKQAPRRWSSQGISCARPRAPLPSAHP